MTVKPYYFSDKLSNFDYLIPKSIEEAVDLLQKYKGSAKLMAGGTNIIPALRLKIFPVYPEKIINLKGIKELKYIKEESGFLKIGALTTFSEILENKIVDSTYKALTEAALTSAPPQHRNLMTIGGEVCKEPYSWYMWNPNPIARELISDPSYIANEGMNQYLSIFGGSDMGYAVNISNIAVALSALNAKIVTTQRTIPIEEFYQDKMGVTSNTILAEGEIVKEIQIPKPDKKIKQAFMRISFRKFIDESVVSSAICANMSSDTIEDVRIFLGSVAPKPIRATQAENFLKGKKITPDVAKKAGEESVQGATPLSKNAYKVKLSKVVVKRTLLSL
jgi:CO/xanthine dehydrogenase FAD-binding subunit